MMFDDLTFLKDVSQWPSSGRGKFCCLRKRVEGRLHLAYIMATEPLLLRTGNIFNGGDGGMLEYVSADAIINDGWRVD